MYCHLTLDDIIFGKIVAKAQRVSVSADLAIHLR